MITIPDALQALRPVIGYEGLYCVSEDGCVYSLQRGKTKQMSPTIGNSGYMKLRLKNNGIGKSVYVHRVVAESFIGSISGMDINHIDGNKCNNRSSNLEIVSRAENMKHARESGLWNPANNKSEDRRVVPDSVVIAARAEYNKGKRGFGVRAIAEKFGVSKTVMECILANRTYKEVTA